MYLKEIEMSFEVISKFLILPLFASMCFFAAFTGYWIMPRIVNILCYIWNLIFGKGSLCANPKYFAAHAIVAIVVALWLQTDLSSFVFLAFCTGYGHTLLVNVQDKAVYEKHWVLLEAITEGIERYDWIKINLRSTGTEEAMFTGFSRRKNEVPELWGLLGSREVSVPVIRFTTPSFSGGWDWEVPGYGVISVEKIETPPWDKNCHC
jgi:hypothetical protein